MTLPPPPVPCNYHKVETKCADCGKKVIYNSPFNDAKHRTMRCPTCFDAFVQKEYVGLIHDGRDSGEKERQRALAPVGPKGKRKKTPRTTCKWCGRTDHITRRSKKCPCNPKSDNYDPNFKKTVVDNTTVVSQKNKTPPIAQKSKTPPSAQKSKTPSSAQKSKAPPIAKENKFQVQ